MLLNIKRNTWYGYFNINLLDEEIVMLKREKPCSYTQPKRLISQTKTQIDHILKNPPEKGTNSSTIEIRLLNHELLQNYYYLLQNRQNNQQAAIQKTDETKGWLTRQNLDLLNKNLLK